MRFWFAELRRIERGFEVPDSCALGALPLTNPPSEWQWFVICVGFPICDVAGKRTQPMMDEKAFNELVSEIKSQGYDEKTAAHYAELIGDTPGIRYDGAILVMDGEQVVARLKPLRVFEET